MRVNGACFHDKFVAVKRKLPIPKFLINKYFLTSVFFLVWIIFFDKNNLIAQYELRTKLAKLRTEKKYYKDEIRKNRKELTLLLSDIKYLEKFAREKYLMKRDNEEIFYVMPLAVDSTKVK